jgi:hypothetical protein
MRPSPFSNSQIHWCQSSKSYCWQDNVSRFVLHLVQTCIALAVTEYELEESPHICQKWSWVFHWLELLS